jgi:hypothetical protein
VVILLLLVPGPVPAALVAVTVNVYAVAADSPLMLVDVLAVDVEPPDQEIP